MASKNRFPLTSDECELLMLFEATQALQEVAVILGKDHSVIARAFKRISERFPVVEKKSGKWILTEMGKSLNEVTRNSLDNQISALTSSSRLRIGTNREFAARVLCPDFKKFQNLFPKTELTINAYQQGTESALLNGQVDIAIDCDRPSDPDIAFKLLVEEEIIAVASPQFLKEHKLDKKGKRYRELPHLLCDRLNPDKILSSLESRTVISARFNDIAATRAACVRGAGWALLPSYSLKEELEKGLLVKIDEQRFGSSKYGIWWLRGRSHMQPSCERISYWLKMQKL